MARYKRGAAEQGAWLVFEDRHSRLDQSSTEETAAG